MKKQKKNKKKTKKKQNKKTCVITIRIWLFSKSEPLYFSNGIQNKPYRRMIIFSAGDRTKHNKGSY